MNILLDLHKCTYPDYYSPWPHLLWNLGWDFFNRGCEKMSRILRAYLFKPFRSAVLLLWERVWNQFHFTDTIIFCNMWPVGMPQRGLEKKNTFQK
jgi:hypothetical protein